MKLENLLQKKVAEAKIDKYNNKAVLVMRELQPEGHKRKGYYFLLPNENSINILGESKEVWMGFDIDSGTHIIADINNHLILELEDSKEKIASISKVNNGTFSNKKMYEEIANRFNLNNTVEIIFDLEIIDGYSGFIATITLQVENTVEEKIEKGEEEEEEELPFASKEEFEKSMNSFNHSDIY